MRVGGEIAFVDAICTAQTARLNTVKSASPSARRAFMYGQTTARALAACLGDAKVPAYRLLAEGMRFEARLAVDVCEFSVDEMFAQDDHLEDLGIEELSFDIDPDAFVDAIRAERFRRSNRFQLALPKNPGIIRLATVDDDVLERHARAFLASFVDAIRAERFRRSNRFQLALPKNPGIIRLATVDDDVLERHARAFLASRRP